MVLSANISAVGDAAGAVLIIVENLPRPVDRRVRATNPTLSEARGIPTCVPQKSVDHNPCASAARAPNRLS